VASAAVGLTVSKFNAYAGYEVKALLTLETAEIRWWIDGTDPTATEGHPLEAGQNLTLEGYKNLSQFRAIRTGATSGVLKVTYLLG
jgi:hypothetical protein